MLKMKLVQYMAILCSSLLLSNVSYATYMHPQVNPEVQQLVRKHYPFMMFSHTLRYCQSKYPHLKPQIKRAESQFLLNLSISMSDLQQKGEIDNAYLEQNLSDLNRKDIPSIRKNFEQQLKQMEQTQGSAKFCPSLITHLTNLSHQDIKKMFSTFHSTKDTQ